MHWKDKECIQMLLREILTNQSQVYLLIIVLFGKMNKLDCTFKSGLF